MKDAAPITPVLRMLARCWVMLALLFAVPAAAQAPQTAPTSTVMTIATHEAPPFAIKGPDGHWSGLAIDLWRDIAKEQGLSTHFQETDLNGMVDGVASGKYAASVGALTVTPRRETRIDFTQPFYTTGFGIVTGNAPPGWLVLFRNFFTWSFLQAVLLLAGLLLLVGLLFWWVERDANDEFGGRTLRGIGSGFWFSAVTMTTVGYGDKAPKTTAGRIIAVVWMFAAIIIISTFTGLIASSLTESRLGGKIRGQDDLKTASVGSIRGSASDDWLRQNDIGFRGFPSVSAGLAAVKDGRIDAFVYDRPLLRYAVNNDDDNKLRLLPGVFGHQDYAFALPQGSADREAIDVALLRRINSPEWADLVKQTLGDDS